MSTFTDRIDVIKGIFTGISSINTGAGSSLTSAGSAAQSSGSSSKQTAKEKAFEGIKDKITFDMVINVTKADSSVESFTVNVSLNGIEAYIDTTLITGSTLIVGVTTS